MPSSTSNSDAILPDDLGQRLRDLAAARDAQWQREERWLMRRWILFPVAGLVAAYILFRFGWYFITLDPSLVRPFAFRALAGPYVAIPFAAGLVPAAWWWLLRLQRKHLVSRWRFPLAAVVMALAVLAADVSLRLPSSQNAFWLAVLARVRPGTLDYFIRELGNIRLAVASREDMDRGPGVIFAGSSQVLRGIDFDALRAAWPDRPVKRRALAGMDPVKACTSQEYLSIGHGDTLVMYIAEMDIGANQKLLGDWMRPLASVTGVRTTWQSADARLILSSWRTWCDLWMASSFELWRSRDYVMHLLRHATGPESDLHQQSHEEVVRAQQEGYVAAVQNPEYDALHYACIRRLAGRMKAAGGQLVVFEGQVNPVLWTPAGKALRVAVRQELQAMEGEGLLDFVPASEQDLRLEDTDWADGTHVNDSGRAKLTYFVKGYLDRALRGATNP